MYIPYQGEFSLGYYNSVIDLQFKLKAFQRLLKIKKALKEREKEKKFFEAGEAYC